MTDVGSSELLTGRVHSTIATSTSGSGPP